MSAAKIAGLPDAAGVVEGATLPDDGAKPAPWTLAEFVLREPMLCCTCMTLGDRKVRGFQLRGDELRLMDGDEVLATVPEDEQLMALPGPGLRMRCRDVDGLWLAIAMDAGRDHAEARA